MGTWGIGAFENDAACDLKDDVLDPLQAELVEFTRRGALGYQTRPERARAAMVLLTAFARGGARWVPRDDVTPARIIATFESMLKSQSEAAEAVREELEAFEAATAHLDAVMTAPSEDTVERALLRIGATARVCRWARRLSDDFDEAWEVCEAVRDLPVLALAAGVPAEQVLRAIAAQFFHLASDARSTVSWRPALLGTLQSLADSASSSSAARSETRQVLVRATRVVADERRAHHRAMERVSGDEFVPRVEDPLVAYLWPTLEVEELFADAQRGPLDPELVASLTAQPTLTPLARSSFINGFRADLSEVYRSLRPPLADD